MKDIYLLVCEGPSDIAIIKSIASRMSSILGRDIEIRELAPTIDATTKQYPRHGWKEVKKWCERYGDNQPDITNRANSVMAMALQKIRQRYHWKSIMALSNAKGLIIHLDTDIAHNLTVNGVTHNNGSPGHRQHCANAITNWLGLTAPEKAIYFLLPSYATENWILATHDNTDSIFGSLQNGFDYEEIVDPATLMIAAGYKSYYCQERQKTVLSKKYKNYEAYGKKVAVSLELVALRCNEVDMFCTYLI